MGVKAGQPKLIVNQDDGPSPMRALAQQVLNSRDFKRKFTKKSKSQTIQTSSGHHARTGRALKPRKFLEFLNQSLNPHAKSKDHEEVALEQVKQKLSNSADRKKLQMKYLNFHRKNVIKHSVPPRSASALNYRKDRLGLNKTQSTSADRIPRLNVTYTSKSKTGSAISRHVFGHNLMKEKRENAQSAIEMTAITSPFLQNELDSSKHRVSQDRQKKIDKIVRDNLKKEQKL